MLSLSPAYPYPIAPSEALPPRPSGPPQSKIALVSRLIQELADPISIATMVAGGAVFQSARLGVRSWLLSRSIGTQALAFSAGATAEVPGIVFSSRGLHHLYRGDRGSQSTVGQEMAAVALSIGPLRVFGMGGFALARNWGYARGAVPLALSQGGNFLGIMAGQWGERRWLHHASADWATALNDGIKFYGQFLLGGLFLPRPFENFFHRWESHVRLREQAPLPSIPASMGISLQQTVTEGGAAFHPLDFGNPKPIRPVTLDTMQNVAMSGNGNGTSGTPYQPKVAIIGGGMSGFAAARTFRKMRSEKFQPEITLFEARSNLGGKAAPRNLGAQFLDETGFEGLLEMVQEHGLKTMLRSDYDAARFEVSSIRKKPRVISGEKFLEGLQKLRDAALQELRTREGKELDQGNILDFIKELKNRGVLDADQAEGMITRMALEEGTFNISKLYFGIYWSNDFQTPKQRLEIVGGMKPLFDAEAKALRDVGGNILTQTSVKRIKRLQEGLEIFFRQDKKMHHAFFDYAVVALAPEHLKDLKITGSQIPWDFFASLTPGRITKTNVYLKGEVPGEEIANNRFAKWFSLSHDPNVSVVTFFHGWQNRRRLRHRELIREVGNDPSRVIAIDSKIWEGRRVEGVRQSYTTVPQPGEAFRLLSLIRDIHFTDMYDMERLVPVGQYFDAGCYLSNAFNSGERGAYSSMRQMGIHLGPDPKKYLPLLFGDRPHPFDGKARDADKLKVIKVLQNRMEQLSAPMGK